MVADDGAPGVGDLAPDFELSDTHGAPVRLSALRGESVMLVFVPAAFTGRCTSEVCELSENLAEFSAAGVRVLGITCDPTPAQRAWQDSEGLAFDLVSDFWPHGEVARAYGVLKEDAGVSLRASFLVDADGVIRERVVNPTTQVRGLDWYRTAIGALGDR
ncbi:MAG: peroxiredoxin [Actinomycetota bacterium]|nr:peroxiredoxin [Actinomycetota bacterium]